MGLGHYNGLGEYYGPHTASSGVSYNFLLPLVRDVSEDYRKNLKWYTDLVWKSEFIIKQSKKGYKDEISKSIFKYFEVKFSEIRQKSENLHPCLVQHLSTHPEVLGGVGLQYLRHHLGRLRLGHGGVPPGSRGQVGVVLW